MREGTGNFQNGDLLYMATHPVADAIRIGRTKPYECSYPVLAEKPTVTARYTCKTKEGEEKEADRIIWYFSSVQGCVERVCNLIPLE